MIALDKLAGIEPHEVNQVLAGPRRWPRPAVGLGGARTLTVWGRTKEGRALMVALRHKTGMDWWIAGARDLTDAEESALAQWEMSRDE
jgi:hypothetical protein